MDVTETTNEQHGGTTVPAQEQAATRNGPGKKKILLIGACIAALLLCVFGVPYFLHALSHESTDDAFIEGDVIPISSRVPGHVAKVYVSSNEWVQKGDVLLELDAHDFEARLDESKAAYQSSQINVELTRISSDSGLDDAKANVEAAKANVESANASVAAAVSSREQAAARLASAKATLAQVGAEVAAAEAQHERDAGDLRRAEDMAKNLILSQQQLDHAVTAERISATNVEVVQRKVETQKMLVVQAEAGMKAADDSVRQAKAGVVFSEAQLDQAQARLTAAESAPQQVALSRSKADAAQAEMQQNQLNLSYTRIVAPSDGYVTKKSVEPGSYVAVGQPLMAIVPSAVWVVGNFKETQLARIMPGQKVKIEVDAFPGVAFDGHVDSIQRGSGARFSLLPPENATGNYIKVVQRVPIKIVFDDLKQVQEYALSPGMSVVPSVDISSEPQSKAADAKALTSQASGEAVDPPPTPEAGRIMPDTSSDSPNHR